MRGIGRAIIIVLVMVTSGIIAPPIKAAVTSCNVTVSPHTLTPNTTENVNFEITNTGDTTINWLTIIPPTSDFQPTDAGASGWSTSFDASQVRLRNGSLDAAGVLTVSTAIKTVNAIVPPGDWTIQASTTGGDGGFNCSGDLMGEINGQITRTDPPVISDINLSNITASSVVITWKTDEPANSQVLYANQFSFNQSGGSYDQQTDVDPAMVTSHMVKLTNLTARTAYHYLLLSTDANNLIGGSDDNTFLTPAVGVMSSSTLNQNQTNVPLTPGKEHIPPTISITTTLAGTYKVTPEIAGTAADNDVLARVEYSLDGGVNWQGVDTITGLGTKKASFHFTPKVTEDGNYDVVARAIDAALNIGLSTHQTLVIDTGPPVIGGVFFSLGPQPLVAIGGVMHALAGVDQTVTLNAAGGPTTITLVAAERGGKRVTTQFALSRSAVTGLWNGLSDFAEPGDYDLLAQAVDGAGNQSSRGLGELLVEAAGKVSDVAGQAIAGATISVYTKDSQTDRWVSWDAAPFAQTNPQVTTRGGHFEDLLPAGQYYVDITKSNFQTVRSPIFSLDSPTPLNGDVTLNQAFGFRLGSVGLWWPGYRTETSLIPQSQATPLPTTGGELPRFSLPTATGRTITDIDLLGRPTVISLMTTWAPPSTEQLPLIDALAGNPNINVIPVFALESLEKVKVYRAIGGYQADLVVDQTGLLVSQLPTSNLPTHYFYDRHGRLQKVLVGVLTADQLLNQLSTL